MIGFYLINVNINYAYNKGLYRFSFDYVYVRCGEGL